MVNIDSRRKQPVLRRQAVKSAPLRRAIELAAQPMRAADDVAPPGPGLPRQHVAGIRSMLWSTKCGGRFSRLAEGQHGSSVPQTTVTGIGKRGKAARAG